MAYKLSIESDLHRVVAWTAKLSKSLSIAVADSMTYGARSGERAIKAQAPKYLDKPTPWTMNSTFVKPARSNRLSVAFGFKDYANSGTPAAKYLQPQVGGGNRSAKGAEKKLRLAQVIAPNQFIAPTGVTPLKLNSYGNISGSTFVQVLSRLKALEGSGFTANVAKSKRSQGKRAQRDYFAGTPGDIPFGIQARLGRRPTKWKQGGPGRPPTSYLPRGFHTVFNVLNSAPKYKPIFPADVILAKTFENTFAKKFQELIDKN